MTDNDILDAVRAELCLQLGVREGVIDPDDELDLLPNADSVRLMRTVSALERQFNVELDDDAIRKARTVAELTTLIVDELAAEQPT